MEREPAVEVLLSTFNGEKFIHELLTSVINQRGVRMDLLIRDDGSTDSTCSRIEQMHDHRIRLIKSDNMGPQKSFLELIRRSGQRDYYAYCDQDDIWYEDKLIRAIEKIKEVPSCEPALYMSTYDVVNANLDYMFTYDMHFEIPLRIEDTILYRSPSGCIMVFNRALRDLLLKTNPGFIRMHDFWTLLIAEAVDGHIITDNTPTMKYRQHEDSTVGITPSLKVRARRLAKSAFRGKNERWRQAKCLYEEKDHIPITKGNLEKIKKVADYRKGIRNRIRLAFDPAFKTRIFYINVLFRLSVLMGVF